MTTEPTDETTGELLPATRPAARAVDLRNQTTDSWTDVLDDTINLARGIANTEFVPRGLRGSVEKTTAAVLYARELGLEPMTGLGATHVIEGKAGISAEMMRALVLRAGHELVVKRSDRQACEIWGRRKGQEEWTRASFGMDEANQTQVFISKEKGWAPLSSKATWRSWPAEMLLARATTRLVRMIFPDVAHGMRTVEELQDMTEEVADDRGPVPDAPAAARPIRRRRMARPEPVAQPATPATAPDKAQEPQDATGEPAPTEDTPDVQEATPADPEPVRRRRTARPAPRTPEPEPVTEPDQPEIIDAEIVEDEPDDDSGYLKAAMIHWRRLGIQDRAERLRYTSALARRNIKSTHDLSADELEALARRLARVENRDGLIELMKAGAEK